MGKASRGSWACKVRGHFLILDVWMGGMDLYSGWGLEEHNVEGMLWEMW